MSAPDGTDLIPQSTWDMIRRVDPTDAPQGAGDSFPEEYAQRSRRNDAGGGGGGGSRPQPLEFVNASKNGIAKVRVINGDINNQKADAAMAGGADKTLDISTGNHVWIEFTCARNVDSNAWTRTTEPEINDGPLPAPTATRVVCDLGSVTVAGGTVTLVGSVRRSSLSWERCGVDDAFVDKFDRA